MIEYTLKNKRFADLFCGVGGFHQALSSFGCQCVFACDKDSKCRLVYERNYNVSTAEDIMHIDLSSLPKFEILCAGFPCQPFSKAGHQQGFADTSRGNLFFKICEIAQHIHPDIIILENVRNICTHDKGYTWTTIRSSIDTLGYHVVSTPIIANPLSIGTPQNRERAFIIAWKKSLSPKDCIDTKDYLWLSQRNTIKDLNLSSILRDEERNTNRRYAIQGKVAVVETVWNRFLSILRHNHVVVPKFPLWTDLWDCPAIPLELSNKYQTNVEKNLEFYQRHRTILHDWLLESRTHHEWKGAVRKLEWQARRNESSLNDCLWTLRPSGIRAKSLDYSPALVAIMTIPIYGPESRYLTPRECCRLQDFPETFIINNIPDRVVYKQMGNAVNVNIVKTLLLSLFKG